MKKDGQKDYFSSQANVYAAFRPTYPEAMYQFIFQHLNGKRVAWDCATGNGQVAGYLAEHFDTVYATDISQQQLDNTIKKKNIFYSMSSAEKAPFQDHQFDLITVGQALHWFDRDKFYNEVRRVGQSGALLAVWGYAFLNVEPSIDNVILNFYNNIIGPYWDDARRLVEEEYRTIEFPFVEIESPGFFITAEWTLQHLAGYLESWSATQKFINNRKRNPIPEVVKELMSVWHPSEVKTVRFPVFLKLTRIP